VPGESPLLGGSKRGDKGSTHICPPHLSGVRAKSTSGFAFRPLDPLQVFERVRFLAVEYGNFPIIAN